MHTLSSRTLPLPRTLAFGAGLALLLLAAGAALAARPVHAVAPNSTVDTLADGHLDVAATTCVSTAAGHKCTLRAALELNTKDGGGSTITLGAPGQIVLTLGELVIGRDVTITGTNAATNSVKGDGSHRVFDVDALGAHVAMSGFAVVGGKASTSAGGGILNLGTLTLSQMNVAENVAAFGGGIADAGALTLQAGTTVTMNQAVTFVVNQVTNGGVGGGVAEFGTLVATGVLLNSNTAAIAGGDLGVDFATLREAVIHGTAAVTQSTIETGHAPVGGGAFLNTGESATFTADTFVDNVAREAGGAIESECGAMVLVNDTLTRNRADGGFGGAIAQECFSDSDSAPGIAPSFGGVRNAAPVIDAPQTATVQEVVTTPTPVPTPVPQAAKAAVDLVTMADNTALIEDGGSRAGAIIEAGDLSSINVHNTIVKKKSGDTGKDCIFESGAKHTSQGYNLENANDCAFTSTGDQTSVDPQLGALASNGGPTQTMALSAGTPAVDTADPTCSAHTNPSEATDQRGVSRPQGKACDIGAFELQVAAATPTALPSPPVTGHGRTGGGTPLLALILALLALPVVGAGLAIARRRSTTA